MLKFYTAGESHGQALLAFVSGLPASLPVDLNFINNDLHRRQLGYGRGGRQKIEKDRAEIFAGVRHGQTIGAPVALRIENRDWANWEKILPVEATPESANLERKLLAPRPGHADLAGSQKFNFHDARYVLERASARETAARVAGGAFAKLLLRQFGTEIASHTLQVGHVRLQRAATWQEIHDVSTDLESPLRCVDPATQDKMKAEVDAALKAGDTVGGIFEIVAHNVPVGLGSHAQWDEKLDGRLAQALMSVQAVKAVELGEGVSAAGSNGSEVQDEISYDKPALRFRRSSNRAGGLEGGITNGEDVILRGYLKPISTLRRALHTADMVTKEPVSAAYERSDWCVVPAGAVAGEAMVALVLADAFLQKFGGDSLSEMRRNFDTYARQIAEF
ncbi:MAG TPA: chorismate synthase [Candidatus Acidoferrum sp.]|nr:chorismate synthase [Candidatus Acidoferrum sp.]